MKNLIFLFLILLILGFLAFPRVANFLTPQKSYSSIKIESVPDRTSIFLDEKEVGVTPWESKEIEAGVHRITLIVNDSKWEGKVEVAAGTETFVKRILGPSLSFSGGVSTSHQKTKDGDSGAWLALTVKPENTKVFIDEKEWETMVTSDIPVGEHKLKFSQNGYLTEEISIKTKNGFLVNCDVEMMIDPFSEVKEKVMESMITEGTEEEKEGAEDLEIKKRTEWGGQIFDATDENLKFASWQKIEVYPIIFPDLDLAAKVIEGMDFCAREFLGLPGLPFAYLITEEGEVYEGVGLRNFDFSEISNQKSAISNQQKGNLIFDPPAGGLHFEFIPGVCPVAYLSTSTVELTESAQNALSNLQAYLIGPPRQSAKIITALEEITISPGETREVTLEFQNTGEAAWANTGDKRIFLVTAPAKRVSEFYHKDSWIAVDTISLLCEEKVLPGQIGKFTFSLTAPFYPTEVGENLGLLIEGTQQLINDSEISLPIKVWAEGLVAVEIKDTPTGFLNVRDGPSTYAKLLGTVYPHEKYLFLEEQADFYKIKLRDGSEGWVYAKYAEKKYD